MRPKSSGEVFRTRRSRALIVPFWIGTSIVFPVRLSVTVTDCRGALDDIVESSSAEAPWPASLTMRPGPATCSSSDALFVGPDRAAGRLEAATPCLLPEPRLPGAAGGPRGPPHSGNLK